MLIDKPIGWTSHDVVAKVRNILSKEAGKKVKVGHTGTLDPLASGLLVLVVGSYTKRASEFSGLDKSYVATIKLGSTSSTGDEEGEKTKISDNEPSKSEVERTIQSFIGDSEQTPPAYSAIKIDGKRAYQLARKGKQVKLEKRKITVHGIQISGYNYPELKFVAKVSAGTYIRSLAEDIGEKLGTGAYLTQLRRTMVGGFSLEHADRVTELNIDKIIQSVV